MQEISSIVKLNHLSSSEKKGNFLKARSDKSINATSSFIGQTTQYANIDSNILATRISIQLAKSVGLIG